MHQRKVGDGNRSPVHRGSESTEMFCLFFFFSFSRSDFMDNVTWSYANFLFLKPAMIHKYC